MIDSLLTCAGIAAALLVVVAYYCLESGRLKSDDRRYYVMNAVSSCILIVSIAYEYDQADSGAILMETCWLAISANVTQGPVRQLSIVVEDDGPGISAAHQEFVLQRGARLDTLAQGQGIGLAVVTDIVSSYGGQIDVGTGQRGGARIQLVFQNFQSTDTASTRA